MMKQFFSVENIDFSLEYVFCILNAVKMLHLNVVKNDGNLYLIKDLTVVAFGAHKVRKKRGKNDHYSQW